ncbi:MAG: DNA-binding protein [Clostridiales bacterium]|nr:DNA-binding protein [Clostridiales bacterium]
MMSKDLNISRLCDVYGELLTEHRREVVRDYYDCDLSLAEIAENLGITRQAALCSIKQAEKQLNEYESKLGIAAKTDALERELKEILQSNESMSNIKARLQTIIDGLRQQ